MSIALTFDDGPSEWTGPILDQLAEHDARATFFVVGQNVLGNEDLLERMRDEGHEVGNHTFTHRRLTELRSGDVFEEIGTTQAVLMRALDRPVRFWRAPHFDIDERVREIGRSFALTHVGATIDPSDWKSETEQIVEQVSKAATGSIVDLHDGVMGGNPTRAATLSALAVILDSDLGPFVTIPELQCALAK